MSFERKPQSYFTTPRHDRVSSRENNACFLEQDRYPRRCKRYKPPCAVSITLYTHTHARTHTRHKLTRTRPRTEYHAKYYAIFSRSNYRAADNLIQQSTFRLAARSVSEGGFTPRSRSLFPFLPRSFVRENGRRRRRPQTRTEI